MSRKTINYTVSDNNRDKGKVFVLTEMSAVKAETWAIKALLALMNSGVDIPDGSETMGMAAMAELGLKAISGLKWEIAEPLLQEMMDCVQFMPEPRTPHIVRALFDEDIEEVATRVKLRLEVWKLHINFSLTAANLNSQEPELAAVAPTGSRVIKTSPL